MSDRSETEAYLAAELDSLTQAHAAGDQAAVTQRIEHVRAEAGPETAAVLERMLKEQEARRRLPTQPEFTPTAPAGGVRELPPPSRTKLLIVFSTVAAALLVAVTVLVTVLILRPPTTTTTPPPPQATGSPAGPTTTPPTSTTTSSTDVPPPVVSSTALPPAQTWRPAWPQPQRITMPGEIGQEYGADFDTPRVVHSMYSADLTYYGGSLDFNSDLLGTGPATLPTPEACYSATNQAVERRRTLRPGTTAWCMVTRGSLVWLHLLSGGGSRDPVPTLTFELMRWEKPS